MDWHDTDDADNVVRDLECAEDDLRRWCADRAITVAALQQLASDDPDARAAAAELKELVGRQQAVVHRLGALQRQAQRIAAPEPDDWPVRDPGPLIAA